MEILSNEFLFHKFSKFVLQLLHLSSECHYIWRINFNEMKNLVLNGPTETRTLINSRKMMRSKSDTVIYNVVEKKKYRLVYTKRIILENYDTVPYGTTSFFKAKDFNENDDSE